MWNHRDQYLNPLKTLLAVIGIAIFAALVLTGMVGAIWGTVEMFRHITTWVL